MKKSSLQFLFTLLALFVVLISAGCGPDTTAIENYGNEVVGKISACDTSIQKLNEQTDKWKNDETLLQDATWQKDVQQVLSEMDSSCGTMGDSANVPEDYQAANDKLKDSAKEFKLFTAGFGEAIEAQDLDAIIGSLDHLTQGAAEMQAAADLMPGGE